MPDSDLSRERLFNQQIAATKFKKPQEIVEWMGLMQAQDFAMAKWAIGLRLAGLRETDIEKVFNEGYILRTHLLRPTWHFVSPKDIRWMLSLTAPRVNALNAYWYRKFELDTVIFKRCNDILARALQGGKQLTRIALKSFLDRSRIIADGLRLSYIFMRAELDGIICSGARDGKQFTYALLDEIVPSSSSGGKVDFNREQALAELAMRYFTSRGPATILDFAYWSAISLKDAKTALASLKPELIQRTINGDSYFSAQSQTKVPVKNSAQLQTTFLLPDYDEFGISYKDRTAIVDTQQSFDILGNNGHYNHVIVIDGKIAGTWQRKTKNNAIFIETTVGKSLNTAKQLAVTRAVKCYCNFTEKNIE